MRRYLLDRLMNWLSLLLLLGTTVFLVVSWPRIPSEVPMHFNALGEIDRWGGKGGPAGDRLGGLRPDDGGGALPQPLEHRRPDHRGKPGASLPAAGASAEHPQVLDHSHVRRTHPLVRPGPAPAGMVLAGGAGGPVRGHDLLAGPGDPGPIGPGNGAARHLACTGPKVLPLRKRRSMLK